VFVVLFMIRYFVGYFRLGCAVERKVSESRTKIRTKTL